MGYDQIIQHVGVRGDRFLRIVGSIAGSVLSGIRDGIWLGGWNLMSDASLISSSSDVRSNWLAASTFQYPLPHGF
eukprot:802294-Amorphochlora_amoeboformis.AAC.1